MINTLPYTYLIKTANGNFDMRAIPDVNRIPQAIIWYKFNSGDLNTTNSTIYNYFTRNNDSITVGNSSINTSISKFGGASIQGTGASQAFYTNFSIKPPDFSPGGGYTITFWAYISSTAGWGCPLFYWAPTNTSWNPPSNLTISGLFGYNYTNITFGNSNTGTNLTDYIFIYDYSPTTLAKMPQNIWCFISVVVTYVTSTSSKFDYYLTTTTMPTTPTYSSTVNTNPSNNSYPFNFFYSSGFGGSVTQYIDDFRYFNIPLTLLQLQNLYNYSGN